METSSKNNDSDSSKPFFARLSEGPSVLSSPVNIRLAFMRKVYGILSIQLAFTTVVCASIMALPTFQGFLIQNSWILYLNTLAGTVCFFPLLLSRNEYPTNFYLLGAFTLFQSVSLGMFACQYDTISVVQAFFVTTAILISLTIFTFIGIIDFTWFADIRPSLLLGLFYGGLFHYYFGNSLIETLLNVHGACVISAFIIVDTQMIMKYLSAEEYILGVLSLYLNMIDLFIKILKTMKKKK